MTKTTNIVNGVPYCGTLEIVLPFVGMRDAVAGACVAPPSGQPIYSILTYVPSGTGSRQADITKYNNIMGWYTGNPSEVQTPFPGKSYAAPVIGQFPEHGIVACAFDVPHDIPVTKYGWIGFQEYNSGGVVESCISAIPNDMVGANAGCHSSGVAGQTMPRWYIAGGGADPTKRCVLVPGNRYYYNMRATSSKTPGAGYFVIGLTNTIGG